MSAPRFEELASLVAIGAATDIERAELERMLAADPSLAAEMAVWDATASSLADSLEPIEPPADGLAKLQAALGQEEQAAPEPFSVGTPEYAEDKPASPAEGADVISLAARRQKRILSSGLALTFAAAAAFLIMWLRERDAASELRDAAAQKDQQIEDVRKDAQVEIDRLAKELASESAQVKTLTARYKPLRSATLELATLKSDAGGYAHVFAEVGPSGERQWLVIADSLPTIGADKDYQLWFVPADGKPVSAGLLRPGPDGVVSATPTVPADLAGTKLRPAISLEPSGGSKQPTDVKLIGEPI